MLLCNHHTYSRPNGWTNWADIFWGHSWLVGGVKGYKNRCFFKFFSKFFFIFYFIFSHGQRRALHIVFDNFKEYLHNAKFIFYQIVSSLIIYNSQSNHSFFNTYSCSLPLQKCRWRWRGGEVKRTGGGEELAWKEISQLCLSCYHFCIRGGGRNLILRSAVFRIWSNKHWVCS